MSNLFLTTVTADAAITAGTGTKWVAGTAAGGTSQPVVKHTQNPVVSPNQMTDSATTADGTVVSWYTDPLLPVTITGTVTCSMWTREVSTATNAAPVIQIERVSNSGVVLSTVVAATVNEAAGEMATTAGGAADTITLTAAQVTDTTLSAGDRLRITLWMASAATQGGTGTLITTATHYAQFWVNGPTGSAGQSQLAFTETLTTTSAAVAVRAAGAATARNPTPPVKAVLASGSGKALRPQETSPPLELSGFGTFTGVGAGDAINAVVVTVNQFSSSPQAGGPLVELWDYSGAPALIGSGTGAATVDQANVDSFTFTGVTYPMLASLRVRIYARQGTAAPGAVANVNWAGLYVSYTPAPVGTVNAGPAQATGTAPGATGSAGVSSTGWLYPAAGSGAGWVNIPGAVGSTQGNYATWTDAGAGSAATLELSGFAAQDAVPAGSAPGDVTVVVRHDETAGVASVTAQAYAGAVPVGSPQALTVAAGVHEDTVTVTGMSWADLADLRVRVTATRA